MGAVESAALVTEGKDLVLKLSIGSLDVTPVRIGVQLVEHDGTTAEFAASFGCVSEGDVWVGRIALEKSNRPRLLELVNVYAEEPSVQLELVSRHLFHEPTSDGEWEGGDQALVHLSTLEEEQRQKFQIPVITPGATKTDPKYAVVVLAENLLLTRPQRIPGIAVIPVSNSPMGSDQVYLLNELLPQVGFQGQLDLDWWVNMTSATRPTLVVSIPEIHASNEETARNYARRIVFQVFDLLALRRGAPPRALGGVVGLWNIDTLQTIGQWIEGSYGGNLLGGFTSGESEHSLQLDWAGMQQYPRARLWVSLFEDALRDERWDFRFFRFFSLLEAIGIEILPENDPILDEQGRKRMINQVEWFTTKQSRGKIYELKRLVSGIFGSTPPGNKDWDEFGAWAKVRNQVAHQGGWAVPEGQRPTSQHIKTEAKIAAFGHDGTFESGADAILRSAGDLTSSVLFAALQGKL